MKTIMLITLFSSLSFAQTTRLEIEDVVRVVRKEDKRDRIIFNQHAGIYQLSKNSKDYLLLEKALLDSQKNKKKIKLSADPTTLEIEQLLK